MTIMALDLDDYTQDVADVARRDFGPKTGDELRDEGEEFYRHNGALLHAHLKAARLLQERGIPVSARFLTEFARWSTKLMWLMPQLFEIYRDVPVTNPERGLKIPNATSAWLTRWLVGQGIDARKVRSKMDGAK